MANKFNISVVIGAVDKLTAPLKKVQTALNKTFKVQEFNKLSRSLGQFSAAAGIPKLGKALSGVKDAAAGVLGEFKNLALGGGVLAGLATGLFLMVKGTSDYGDRIAKVAGSVGITSEALQEFRFAAERSGVEAEVMDKSLQKFSATMGQLKAGTGSLHGLLEKVSPTFLLTLKGAKGTEDAFMKTLTAISKLKDPAKQAALATAAFGKSGVGLINLAKEGPKGIDELRKKARQLGIMSNENAAAAEVYNDKLFDMIFALTNLKNTIGVALFPVFQEWIDKVTTFATQNKEQILEFARAFAMFIRDLIPQVVSAGKTVVGFFVSFDQASGQFSLNFGRIKLLMAALAIFIAGPFIAAIFSLIVSLKALGLTIALTPIGWFLGVLALVAGAAYLVYTNWDKVKEFFVNLWKILTESPFLTMLGPIGLLIAAGKALYKTFEPIRNMWDKVGSFTGLGGGNANAADVGARDLARTDTLTNAASMMRSQGGQPNRSEASVLVKFDNLPPGARVQSEKKGFLDLGLDMTRGPMTSMQ